MRKSVRTSTPSIREGSMGSCRVLAGAALAAVVLTPVAAGAQAWAYPSFQPPVIMNREFNFGVADAGHAGTSLVFQWREGLTNRTQFSIDAGFADPDGKGNGKLLLGAQFAGLLNDPRPDLPLAFLVTGGLNFAAGDGADLVRIPFGVSIGHRFPLDEGFAITPYIHPRLSLDICTDCAGPDNNDSETDLGIDFDIGANFEVTRELAFRVSALFGGSDVADSNGFGISLAWSPLALSRPSRLSRLFRR